ncbi:MAG: ABC transporter ATP-binding protein [Candidatus Limivivens sp.]|nr:ABC transporter ATP-binding protein [Candidatus Limivivens sp.]
MSVNAVREDEQLRQVKQSVTLLRLLRYLLGYRLQIAAVLVMMGISIGIVLINPLLIEWAIDVPIAERDADSLIRLGILAVCLNLLLVLLVKVRMYLMARISNQVLLNIRQELYTHIQTLGFSFFNSRPTGKILARIIGDVNSLKDVLTNCVTTLIPEFLTICAVVCIMLAKDWRLALAALSSIPLMTAGVWIVQSRAHTRWQIYRKKGSNVNAFVHEDLSGIRVVQSLCAQEQTRNTFGRLLKDHSRAFTDACRFADGFGPIVDFCWGLSTLLLYYVGVRRIQSGDASIGVLIAFGSYISMFWHPVLNLSNFYNQLVTNLAGAERIFELIDTPADITDRTGAKALPPVRGEVVFSHVYFSYEDGIPVLSDVSFRAKPGESIALVGPTGAGKTTITHLIARFFDVRGGAVRIDGTDVRDVTLESLRSQLGIMTQENFLFSGTIRDNIRYGRLEATDEEIVEAAKAVHAHEFIMEMDQGYDTVLKERGAGLSVGQKQLLAFARTLVSRPAILILDEATSSIDTRTELLVQEGIQTLLKGRTSFIVAHRLSTIRRADRIFVIDNGGIQEAGSHEELMKKKGAYYRLYMAQFSRITDQSLPFEQNVI